MSKTQSIAQKKRFSKSLNYRKDDWISQSKIVHNDRYDYSKVEYSNQITKVEIICPDHGSFFQRPCDHKNHKPPHQSTPAQFGGLKECVLMV